MNIRVIMTENFRNLGYLSFYTSAKLKVFLVVATILIVGVAFIGDRGAYVDDKIHANSPLFNYRLVAEGDQIPITLRHYGTLFHFTAEAAFQVKSIVIKGATSILFFTSDLSQDFLARTEFRERIELKHGLSFLLFIATCLAVAGIVGILAGPKYAWLGPIALVLIPRLWGHSFFSATDIPFAAMFTVGTVIGAKLVAIFLKSNSAEVKAGLNRITAYSLLYGVLVGLVSGTRIAGCILIAFVAVAHFAVFVGRRKPLREYFYFWSLYGSMFLSWMATVIIIHPASWSNPFVWFVDAALLFSRYNIWEGSNLYFGEFVPAYYAPWHYLPVWLLITTPLLLLALFAIGLVMLLFRYRRLKPIQQACAIMVLLQISVLPSIAILFNSIIYEGLRHFLFMVPIIAAIAATGVAWILQSLRISAYKIAVVVMLIALATPIVVDMMELYPYEYVYFNRVFGGLKAAQNQFETDYHGVSGREAMEWVNENARPGELVVSAGGIPLTETFAAPTIDVIHVDELEQKRTRNPFYYIVKPRYDFQKRFPECPVVYEVTRQDVPLTIVKRCG